MKVILHANSDSVWSEVFKAVSTQSFWTVPSTYWVIHIEQRAYAPAKRNSPADSQVVPILLRHAEGLSHHLPSLLEELRAQGRRGEGWVQGSGAADRLVFRTDRF